MWLLEFENFHWSAAKTVRQSPAYMGAASVSLIAVIAVFSSTIAIAAVPGAALAIFLGIPLAGGLITAQALITIIARRQGLDVSARDIIRVSLFQIRERAQTVVSGFFIWYLLVSLVNYGYVFSLWLLSGSGVANPEQVDVTPALALFVLAGFVFVYVLTMLSIVLLQFVSISAVCGGKSIREVLVEARWIVTADWRSVVPYLFFRFSIGGFAIALILSGMISFIGLSGASSLLASLIAIPLGVAILATLAMAHVQFYGQMSAVDPVVSSGIRDLLEGRADAGAESGASEVGGEDREDNDT